MADYTKDTGAKFTIWKLEQGELKRVAVVPCSLSTFPNLNDIVNVPGYGPLTCIGVDVSGIGQHAVLMEVKCRIG